MPTNCLLLLLHVQLAKKRGRMSRVVAELGGFSSECYAALGVF